MFILVALALSSSAFTTNFVPSFSIQTNENDDWLWLRATDSMGDDHYLAFNKSNSGLMGFGKNLEYYGEIALIPVFQHPTTSDYYLCPIIDLDSVDYHYNASGIGISGSDSGLTCYEYNNYGNTIDIAFTINLLGLNCGENGQCKLVADVVAETGASTPSDTGFGFFFRPLDSSKYRYVRSLSQHIDLFGSDQNYDVDTSIEFLDENENLIGNSWDWSDMVCPTCVHRYEVLTIGGKKGLLTGVVGLGAGKNIDIDPLFVFVGDSDIEVEGVPDYYPGYRKGKLKTTIINHLDTSLEITPGDFQLDFTVPGVETNIYHLYSEEVTSICYSDCGLDYVCETEYECNVSEIVREELESVNVYPEGNATLSIEYTIPEQYIGDFVKYNFSYLDAFVDPYFNSTFEPILHLELDEPSKSNYLTYDLFDETGNGYNFNSSGGVTYNQTGKRNKSLDFDGNNDIIYSLDDTPFDFTVADPFTLAGWFYFEEIGSSSTEALFSKRASTNKGYLLYKDGNDKLVWWMEGNGASDRLLVYSNVLSIANNDWHHIALVYDGSNEGENVRFYVDGVNQTISLVSDDNIVGSILNGEPFSIGAQYYVTQYPFRGKIDEVAVWDRELNQSEINDVMDYWNYSTTTTTTTTTSTTTTSTTTTTLVGQPTVDSCRFEPTNVTRQNKKLNLTITFINDTNLDTVWFNVPPFQYFANQSDGLTHWFELNMTYPAASIYMNCVHNITNSSYYVEAAENAPAYVYAEVGCLSDGDCSANQYCDTDNFCALKKGDGLSCSRNAECTNYCVDGVCGTPVIDLTGWDIPPSTNVSAEGDLSNVSMRIQNTYCDITWTENLDLSGGADFASGCVCGPDWASCENSTIPGLTGKEAQIVLRDTSFELKALEFLYLLKDGIACGGDCYVTSKSGAEITFNVSHFTNYSVANLSSYDALIYNFTVPDIIHQKGKASIYFVLKNSLGAALEHQDADVYVTDSNGVVIKRFHTLQLYENNTFQDENGNWVSTVPITNARGEYIYEFTVDPEWAEYRENVTLHVVANGQHASAEAFVDLPEQLDVDSYVSWGKRFSGLIVVYLVAGFVVLCLAGLILYIIIKVRRHGFSGIL